MTEEGPNRGLGIGTSMNSLKFAVALTVLASLGLAGCSTDLGGRVLANNYASVRDAGYQLPAVPLSKLPRQYQRQIVKYQTDEKPGTIIVDTNAKHLHLVLEDGKACLLYTSPSPRDRQKSRMPSSA